MDLTGSLSLQPAPLTVQQQRVTAGPEPTAAASSLDQAAGQPPAGGGGRDKDIAQWFSLFAELDPLSNPDSLGGHQANKDCL